MSSAETGFEVDRALGDGSFSLVNTTAAGVEKYDDTGLAVNTRYRYRVRAIATSGNSLYTAIVTVVTHDCPSAGPFHQELTLPRFTDEPESWQVLLNELAQKLEEQWNSQLVNEPTCTVCAVDGAIDLDCSRCNHFSVTTDEDINSITVENCPGSACTGDDCPEGEIELTVTNSGTSPITVCGWPLNYACDVPNATLNECCHEVFPGNSVSTGFHCSGEHCLTTEPTEGGTGGGGGLGLRILCETILDEGDFGSVNVTTCSKMDCSAGGGRKLTYKGAGGFKPYSWTITTPIEGQPSPVLTTNITQSSVIIEPGGTGSETGLAYSRFGLNWTNTSGTCRVCNNTGTQSYRCNDETFGNCGGGTACDTSIFGCGHADPECKLTGTPRCDGGVPVCTTSGLGCNELTNGTMFQCDLRNQTQKDSGTCEPCGLNVDTAILTLTDAVGTNVSVTIEITP